MENDLEIESVIEGVRNGDQTALERLFDQHRAYLKKVIEMRMGDQLRARVDASDIVQDAQLEALRRVEDFAQNPVMPVRLWLRQIACDRVGMARRHHVTAQRRSIKQELCLPDDLSLSIARQLVAQVASPSAVVSQAEIAEIVRTSIAQMEEADREIIILQAFEGLTSPESAKVLGIEPPAARKRFGRALRKLQEQLNHSGLGESTE